MSTTRRPLACCIRILSEADLIVSLGAVFGSGHATIMISQSKRTIRVWDGNVFNMSDAPRPLSFPELIAQLDSSAFSGDGAAQVPPNEARAPRSDAGDSERSAKQQAAPGPHPDAVAPTAGMTYDALFQVIEQNVTFEPALMAISDTFLGIYPTARIRMPVQDSILASAIWASIGHSVAAAVGVAAAKRKRPIVIFGDGGFQMTVQSLATMARQNLNAIVVIVDNGLYGYEQYLLDPSYYSSSTKPPLAISLVGRWDYLGVARSMGIRQLSFVDTAADLTTAIAAAKRQNGPAVIQAVVQSRSLPVGL